ncbi:hypothetical protein NZD85_10755 [Empedobacter stercoris]|uniref:hypothetical protein n=1 Tax=Empedobacter TaxID=59734 RepID=UPI001CE08156|nr:MULTISPECIES: hypothetical protein [Empedobacter]MCA4781179.1 hypothetical protein [Empedobacter stercoris]MDH1882891.1 hypothetical protein [Empedobacter sp. GD03797]UWX66364.1 hypothetical protein NZD85_10755 [Empedobacter stercoris]
MNNVDKLDDIMYNEIESLEDKKWYKYEFEKSKFKIKKNNNNIKVLPYVNFWLRAIFIALFIVSFNILVDYFLEKSIEEVSHSQKYLEFIDRYIIVFVILICCIINWLFIVANKDNVYDKFCSLLEEKGFKVS